MKSIIETQRRLTDTSIGKILWIRCSNGHHYLGVVPPDTTTDSPEVQKIARRLKRRKPIV